MTLGTDAGALAVEDLGGAMAVMRARGLRVSAARRLVLEALLAADGPMSAEQIAEGIGGRVPSSDIGSVYRNLQALEDIGVVRHVHLGHGPGLHALAVTGEREYLTCERCADYRAVATAGARRGARSHTAPVRLPRELHPLPDRRPLPVAPVTAACAAAECAISREPLSIARRSPAVQQPGVERHPLWNRRARRCEW